MRVLITAGVTREYIDDVRILTNVSSGKLGARIADEFIAEDHEVVFIHSSTSVLPMSRFHVSYIKADSVQDVFKAMKESIMDVDIVVHCMAVSDYYFETDKPVKVHGSDVKAFADFINANARVSPKIISYVKEWNPNVSLVGFKFTVGKTIEDLVSIAKDSCIRNGCDIVVANDKIQMKEAKVHLAYFVKPDGSYEPFYGKNQIAKGLVKRAGSVLE